MYKVNIKQRETKAKITSLGYSVKEIADMINVDTKLVYKYLEGRLGLLKWTEINNAIENTLLNLKPKI